MAIFFKSLNKFVLLLYPNPTKDHFIQSVSQNLTEIQFTNASDPGKVL